MKKLIIFFSAAVLLTALGAVSASASTVTRSFDDAAPAAGSVITVFLTSAVDPADAGGTFIIDEVFPAGWIATDLSGSGTVGTDGHIRWLELNGAASGVFQYTLSVPGTASGAAAFSGEFAFDSTSPTPPLPQILGAASVDVQAAPIPPVLSSISVIPAAATIAPGATQQLTASPLNQNSAVFTGATVSWLSSNPSVATVSATGLVTGVAAGSATITASAASGAITVTNASNITVAVPPVLTSTVTRSFSSAAPVVGSGLTVSLAVDVVAPDTFYIIDEIFSAGWVVANPGTGDTTQAGHIKWAVLTGAASTVLNYTLTVPGTASGESPFTGEFAFDSNAAPVPILGATGVNVVVDPNAPVFTSISITPDSAKVKAGDTKQFNASAFDQFGSPMVPQPVISWTSDNPVVAAVDGNGLVAAVGAGSAVITASSGAISDSAPLTVVVNVFAENILTLISGGAFVVAAGAPATSTLNVTASLDVDIDLVLDGATSTVSIPSGTIITRTDGTELDATLIAANSVAAGALSNLGDVAAINGSLQWGIPNVGLEFSRPITLSIFVGNSLNGQTLNILRSLSGNSGWTADGIVAPATAVVADGKVTFQTTKGSFFAAVTLAPPPAPVPPAPAPVSSPGSISLGGNPSIAQIGLPPAVTFTAAPAAAEQTGGQVLGEQKFADGALIRRAGDDDVYIVKLVGDKQFKRLILSPSVFNSYGHLKWENILAVDRATLDSFVTSDLVRAKGDIRVYKLFPSGDTGKKQWIKTADAFNRLGYDWASIYEINEKDRDSYKTEDAIE